MAAAYSRVKPQWVLFYVSMFSVTCIFLYCNIIAGFPAIVQYMDMINAFREETLSCETGVPCSYPDRVDFRVIVLTYNRPKSLLKLLRSLDTVELDGDTASMEIWIDRSKENKVDNQTLKLAQTFRWQRGRTKVNVQKTHTGIIGQWIDTWSPGDKSKDSKEIVVILEDDISVSPYIYRWLKAVHGHYGHRNDFMGATLTSDELKTLDGKFRPLKGPVNDTVFMYKAFGSWGLSPTPYQWHRFQRWYHDFAKPNKTFRPYVPKIAPTRWYKFYEMRKKEDTMWTIWLLYFAYQEHLFTIYSNLNNYNADRKSCLCICRREVGLHTSAKGREDYCHLLSSWDDKYVKFPKDTARLDWDGKPVNGSY